MSKFLASVFATQGAPPTTPEPPVPEPETPEPPAPASQEPAPETPPVPPVDTPPPDTIIVPEPETPDALPEKKKVLIDVQDFLSTHKDTALQILQASETDFKQLSNEQALRLKLQKENPQWDADDISDELSEKYAIGKERKTVDELTMTDSEIAEAKAWNKDFDKAQRALKKDAVDAKTFLSDSVANLELPKFEYEIEETASEPVDVKKLLEDHYQTQRDQLQTQREQVWVPALDTAIKSIDKLTEQVSYDVTIDGKTVQTTLDLEVELTAEEKSSILTELGDYVASASDEKFIDDKDNINYDAFIREKASVILNEKIKAKIATDAAQKAVNDYVRDNVVNYSPRARNTASHEQASVDFARGVWGNNKNRK